MDYHENGSLYDYLKQHPLTVKEALRIILSIASGLHYIHLDITTGHSVKPGIAHRWISLVARFDSRLVLCSLEVDFTT